MNARHEMDLFDSRGSDVLHGLSGQLICSHLTNAELRTLSESSRHLGVLASATVQSLAPKRLRPDGADVDVAQRFPFLSALDLSLDLSSSNAGGIEASLREASSFKYLQHLKLQKCQGLTDPLLVELANNSSLTSIDFRGCSKLTWAGLGHLKSLPNLRQLNCSGIKYTGQDSAADDALHQALSQLHSLTMGDACTLSWVDDRLMGVVGQHAAQLTHLDCGGCIDITDLGVASIRQLLRLQVLSLQSCVRLTNASLASVAELGSLRQLNIRGCLQITDVGLKQLSSLTKLEGLGLSCCLAVQGLDGGFFGCLRQLASLDLSNCTNLASLGDISVLARSLRKLDISSCSKLKLESLVMLSSLTGLTSLDMSNIRNQSKPVPGVDQELRKLSCLTNMTVLQVSRFRHPHGLPHGLLQAIAGMTSLVQLHMASCSPEAQAAPDASGPAGALPGSAAGERGSQLWFLEGLHGLEQLDLSGWRHVQAGALSSLASLSNITRLSLKRFSNDRTSGSSSGLPEAQHVDPVHMTLRPIACPRPVPQLDLASSGSWSSVPSTMQYGDRAMSEAMSSQSMSLGSSAGSQGLELGSLSLGSSQGLELGSLESRLAAVDLQSGASTRRCCEDASSGPAWPSVDPQLRQGQCSQSSCCQVGHAAASPSLDQALFYLRHMQKLAELDMEACVGLQDPGVAHLACLTSLTTLNLSGCSRLKGETLHRLSPDLCSQQSLPARGCPKLQHLGLDDCPLVGDMALAGIACLVSLRTLSLKGCTQVGDAGLEALSNGLSKLSSLSLFSSVGITSRGITSLSRMPHLKALHLPHCWNVDDKGILQLSRCRSLTQLNVQHCWRISEASIQELQQKCKALDIVGSHS